MSASGGTLSKVALFADPEEWPQRDMIDVTLGMDRSLILEAYARGIFPMPILDTEVVGWFSPMKRAILPLDRLRVTRSLRKTAKRYTVTIDQAFDRVLASCADPRRPHGWINEEIAACYTGLHQEGIVHSVEAWDDQGRLCGGLYGLSLGGFFAGESMFHDPDIGRDASKAALMGLVDRLTSDGVGGRLLDVQWHTPHLASLGVVEVARPDYLSLLRTALPLPAPDWHPDDVSD